MNAKEAKERTLWYKLPHGLRYEIEAASGAGNLEAIYHYSHTISSESDIIKDICNMLEQLGYNVVNPKDFNEIKISWK